MEAGDGLVQTLEIGSIRKYESSLSITLSVPNDMPNDTQR